MHHHYHSQEDTKPVNIVGPRLLSRRHTLRLPRSCCIIATVLVAALVWEVVQVVGGIIPNNADISAGRHGFDHGYILLA